MLVYGCPCLKWPGLLFSQFKDVKHFLKCQNAISQSIYNVLKMFLVLFEPKFVGFATSLPFYWYRLYLLCFDSQMSSLLYVCIHVLSVCYMSSCQLYCLASVPRFYFKHVCCPSLIYYMLSSCKVPIFICCVWFFCGKNLG